MASVVEWKQKLKWKREKSLKARDEEKTVDAPAPASDLQSPPPSKTVHPQPPARYVPLIDKSLGGGLGELYRLLTKKYVQRDQEIMAVLAGIISGEPVALFGEVGVAKTAICEDIARSIRGKFFFYQLCKFTVPDEILGGIDIPRLRNEGVYARRTKNKYPEADIAFFDDFGKASSAILNTFLDAMLNQRFLNGDEYRDLPTLCLLLSSNEVPADDDLRAFYDRVTIRRFVKPVTTELWEDLIKVADFNGRNVPPQTLTIPQILELRKEAMRRAAFYRDSTELRRKYVKCLLALDEKRIFVSDRKKHKVLKVAGAISTIYFEPQPSLDSLADAMRLCAVQDEKDLATVERVLIAERMTESGEMLQRVTTAWEEFDRLLEGYERGRTENLRAMGEVAAYLQGLIRQLEDERNVRMRPYADRCREAISRYRELGGAASQGL